MLTWLRRLFRRPDDREIFAYWDGAKQRRIDPLVAWRKLWGDPDINLGDEYKVALNPISEDGKQFYPDGMVAESEDRLLTLIRKTFDVQPWSESTPGLTIDETLDLLAAFLQFRAALKKKRNPLPMPSPSSATREESASADSTPPDSLPSTESDCGCTQSGSSDGEPSAPLRPSAAL